MKSETLFWKVLTIHTGPATQALRARYDHFTVAQAFRALSGVEPNRIRSRSEMSEKASWLDVCEDILGGWTSFEHEDLER